MIQCPTSESGLCIRDIKTDKIPSSLVKLRKIKKKKQTNIPHKYYLAAKIFGVLIVYTETIMQINILCENIILYFKILIMIYALNKILVMQKKISRAQI